MSEIIISIFIWISLAMAILQVYLRVNKIWKRKHTKEVSESQSIAGNSLLFLNCLIWLVYYFQNNDFKSIADTSIIIFEALVFLLISTGIFVSGQPRLGFWKSFKKALKLEKLEADYLWKRMFKPEKANEIIRILYILANIDNEFDQREINLFNKFIDEWNIKVDLSDLKKYISSDYKENLIYFKELITNYLDSAPNNEQVAQLKDMIFLMIHADEKISSEEQIIKDEIEPLLESYLNNQEIKDFYHVIIVPQNSDSEFTIKSTLPYAEKIKISGGTAYSIGKYFSQAYADVVCKEFRENLQMFTIVHLPDTEI